MIKFQKIAFKFTATTFIVLLIGITGACIADPAAELQTADSLFAAEKYTESFQHYQQVYDAGLYSPAMLLHMAYIKEGLGEEAESLYYLNQYYLSTLDRSARRKMTELAKTNELMGYRFTDIDFIVSVIARYRQTAISLALAACLLVLALVIRYRRVKQQKPVAGLILMMLLLIGTAVFINFSEPAPRGIIMSNQAYLLDQPSAGGDLVEIAGKGHRVKILEDGDVWVKVTWKDQTAYIRKQHLWAVQI